ncbi:hypothetical protein [Breznakia pachnodae]|uniref:Lipoprotein n=1 Tax=Breznakia pachnodae TaxID=265178 RepID=A0ABU0E1U6_9FIRM|nr:hypothetical protein [Breznakia pachnodae]MDQ0360862.1 hypothetical protein [Breznakia pachnodae]
MKKYKGLLLSFLLGVTLLSGCSTSDTATKESVMEDAIKAFNEVESYKSEVTSEQEIEMKSGDEKLVLTRDSKGTTLLSLKDKKALYERELTVGLSGYDTTSETTSYVDFSGKKPTQETIADSEDVDTEMDAQEYLPEKEMSDFFEAVKESEDVKFEEKEDSYVFTGNVNAASYDAIVGYNQYFVGFYEYPSDKELKDVTIEIELVIDKESKLPTSVEVEYKDFSDYQYDMGDDSDYALSSKTAAFTIEYSDYDKVDSDEIKSPVSENDKKDGSKDDDSKEDEKDDTEDKTEDKKEDETEKDKVEAPSTDKDTEEKEEEVKEVTSKESKEATGPWDTYSFIANGTTYALPLEVSKISEFGFVIGIDADMAALEGDGYRSTMLFNSDTMESAMVIIHNPSEETKPIEECQIVSIEVSLSSMDSKHTFSLPGEIGLNTTEEKLNEVYSEYTSFSYSKPIGMYRYGNEYGTFVKVHVRRDKNIVYKFKVSSSGLSN